MSPFAARAPALHCEALPLGAERTAAPAARASATVSSSLPPSTTITSGARPEVDAHARALSTARRTFPASFSVGTTTVMVGRFWARGFGGRRAVASAIEARVAARASRAAVAIAMLTRAEETREAHESRGKTRDRRAAAAPVAVAAAVSSDVRPLQKYSALSSVTSEKTKPQRDVPASSAVSCDGGVPVETRERRSRPRDALSRAERSFVRARLRRCVRGRVPRPDRRHEMGRRRRDARRDPGSRGPLRAD